MTVICQRCHDKDANAIGCTNHFILEHARSKKKVCAICGKTATNLMSCEKYDLDVNKPIVTLPTKTCDNCLNDSNCYIFHENDGNIYKAGSCISFIDKEALNEITGFNNNKNKNRRIQTLD